MVVDLAMEEVLEFEEAERGKDEEQAAMLDVDDPSRRGSQNSPCVRGCRPLCGFLSAIAQRLNCRKQWKRRKRRHVSVSRTPQNGLFIRMHGEIKGAAPREECEVVAAEGVVEAPQAAHPGETSTLDVLPPPRESSSRRSSSRGGASLWEEGERGSIFLPRVASFSGGHQQDAEERLLSRAAGRQRHLLTGARQKFLTLHRRRRRRPPTRGLHKDTALLDDLYHGPTQCLLDRVGDWDFNAFALDSVCGGRPVAVLCAYLIHKYGLLKIFNLDSVTVWKCFSLIEEGYHASNPYHNAIHAADVTQAMHCYLQESTIIKSLTPMELLAAIVSAVCHDLDHPGVNQPFLIATDNHLAALYNNASVLENHHWRCAMGCLWESGLIDSWPAEDIATLQEMMRSLILATDITRQNEFLARFKKYQETNTMDMSLAECRHFSLQIALKCADICNPCRPWEVSRQWSYKICDEFYRQGDYERQLRLPVTTMCDRYANSVAKIQTGFIKYVVAPLFEAWDSWLGTTLSNEMVFNLNHNLERWEESLAEEVAEETTTEVSIVEPVGALQAQEKIDEDAEEVAPLPSASNSSSSESQTSVLGSLEHLSTAHTLVGRRHSLPLNTPSLLPRTVIRRESLSEEGQTKLIYETVVMGDISVASISTEPSEDKKKKKGSVTSEGLFPDPSISAMGEVGRTRKIDSGTQVSRRQSLPPLWCSSSTFAQGRGHPLEPLPQTPLQEEVPLEKDKKEKIESSNATDSQEGSSIPGSTQEQGSSGEGHQEAKHEPEAFQREFAKRDLNGNCKDNCISMARRCSLTHNNTPMKVTEMGEMIFRRGVLKGQVFHRRASLDANYSCKRQLKENLNNKCGRLGSIANSCVDEGDKENRVPLHKPPNVLGKAKMWKSLSQEEDQAADLRWQAHHSGIYKNFHVKGYGRRGSAPLIKPEEIRGGLRGGSEKQFDYFSRRRGSAPSYQLQTGSDSVRLLPGVSNRTLQTKDIMFSQDETNLNNPLSSKINFPRRGSVPGDVTLQPQNINRETCAFKGKGSAGPEPYFVFPSGSTACGGYGSPLMPNLGLLTVLPSEARRGSGSFELLSGLWRTHLDHYNYNNFLCIDDYAHLPSSGGCTPATPGSLGSNGIFNISPSLPSSNFIRRGSLPTEVLNAGEARLWGTEAS